LLPRELTRGTKRILHAPLDAFLRATPPPPVERLLSENALRRAGYFDPQAVRYWRRRFPTMRKGYRRLFVEMGLVGVISTHLCPQPYFPAGGCSRLSGLWRLGGCVNS